MITADFMETSKRPLHRKERLLQILDIRPCTYKYPIFIDVLGVFLSIMSIFFVRRLPETNRCKPYLAKLMHIWNQVNIWILEDLLLDQYKTLT